MENINFIYGKTTDGHNITLDGFRVESFETFENDKGDDCVRLFVKTGKEITVFGEDDERGDFLESLTDFFNADFEYSDKALLHHPESILCETPDGDDFMFDGTAVEFYIEYEDADGVSLIDLHFVSGRKVTVLEDVNQDFYPGENVPTLVDQCFCRYFKNDED